MPRFVVNRWWTLILVLVLALGSGAVVAVPSVAFATEVLDDPVDGGGISGGTSYGDPDVPTGVAKRAPLLGAGRGVTLGSARAAGDGRELRSPGVWSLRAVMEWLRGFVLTF